MGWKTLRLAGWGRTGYARSVAARPERLPDVATALATAEPERGILAYGAGRSYGDCALNDGGRAVLTRRLDRILAFDADTGELVAEPGVTFKDLLASFLPQGFVVPVSPGTAFATLGGAVANDVHGKNHEHAGSFGAHVRWLDLLLPSGETVRVGPRQRSALFRATVAGLGLTGVVVAVCLRLDRVPSNALRTRERRMADLDAFLAAFAERDPAAVYSVGWLDALAESGRLGRGHLITAAPSAEGTPTAPARARRVPLDLPGFALNPWSVRAFNESYHRWRVPAAGRERLIDYAGFLYPLDSLQDWNRIYGRRGFRQFQCVVPTAEGERALRRLLETVTRAGAGSFLSVLKALGPAGPGHLSFAMPGYTLALDFPNRPGLTDLLRSLEAITLEHGGRVYLAKDSCLSAEGFAAMYPDLDRFRAVLAEIDPKGRMQSDMARRLSIRGTRA